MNLPKELLEENCFLAIAKQSAIGKLVPQVCVFILQRSPQERMLTGICDLTNCGSTNYAESGNGHQHINFYHHFVFQFFQSLVDAVKALADALRNYVVYSVVDHEEAGNEGSANSRQHKEASNEGSANSRQHELEGIPREVINVHARSR